MPRQSSDDRDNDHTDELPILLETMVFEDAPVPAAVPEDTGQHTVLYPARVEDLSQTAALRTDLAVRSAKIEELEAEVARLSDRCRDLEGELAPKEASIRDLGRALAALRQSAETRTATERRLAAQLADREARLAELGVNDQQLRIELDTRAAELDRLRASAAAAERKAARLEEQRAARNPASGDPAVQQLLEDNAGLAAYIAGRRRWWDELQAAHAALAARAAALEHELATNVAERQRAAALAAQETNRATSLRAALVEHAHRLEAAEREIGRARRTEDKPEQRPATPAPKLAAPIEAVDDAATSGHAEPTAKPAFDVIAQLEGEVEFKRQQVAAQLVELRDREQRLRGATTELDRLKGDLATLRLDLERSKADAVRLERAVLDKDRALEARDARIATLQDELNQRLGALQRLNARDLPLQALDLRGSERSRSVEPHGESITGPALICLTEEAPKRFVLSKKHMTVGRGPHCDLQVLTHFVSREHARFSLAGNKVLIEDLGSRNGVFVNSVRVDRQELRHGDLVMIGETQFRFVESMAH